MRAVLVFIVIVLAGCAPRTQYVKADGQNVAQQQIELARSACASASEDSYCMVEQGYFLVPAEQAEAKRAQLAAIIEADEQRRRAQLAALASAQERQRAALNTKKRTKAAAKQDVWQPNSR